VHVSRDQEGLQSVDRLDVRLDKPRQCRDLTMLALIRVHGQCWQLLEVIRQCGGEEFCNQQS
jgi:hypothetical protein